MDALYALHPDPESICAALLARMADGAGLSPAGAAQEEGAAAAEAPLMVRGEGGRSETKHHFSPTNALPINRPTPPALLSSFPLFPIHLVFTPAPRSLLFQPESAIQVGAEPLARFLFALGTVALKHLVHVESAARRVQQWRSAREKRALDAAAEAASGKASGKQAAAAAAAAVKGKAAAKGKKGAAAAAAAAAAAEEEEKEQAEDDDPEGLAAQLGQARNAGQRRAHQRFSLNSYQTGHFAYTSWPCH